MSKRAAGMKATIVAVSLVVIGIVGGGLSLALSEAARTAVVPVIGVLFLLGGMFVFIWQLSLREDLAKLRSSVEASVAEAVSGIENPLTQRLVERTELAREEGKVGLVEIHEDCTSVDYGPIITESQRLVVVLNDGRTWSSVHRDRFRRRFADAQKETTFILVHPDSPMVEVLAKKASKEVEIIRDRIRETVQLLEEIKGSSTRLEILGHWLFCPFSVVVGDDYAIVTPYFLSRGGRTVPAFKYRNTGRSCYFRDLEEDVDRLRMDAENIGSGAQDAALARLLEERRKQV